MHFGPDNDKDHIGPLITRGQQKRHEPLAFSGKEFTSTQKHGTTYEKETYAIVQTLERMDNLFWGLEPVHVFTNDRNIFYVFMPLARRPNIPRHVLSEVYRLTIHLSRFEFVIDHINEQTTFSRPFNEIVQRIYTHDSKADISGSRTVWGHCTSSKAYRSCKNKVHPRKAEQSWTFDWSWEAWECHVEKG